MLKIMKASAGSGKTYSLARTYISLLLKNKDRYAYRHILAVTFTNKATDEMKNRILKELHVLSITPEVSPYLKDFVPSIFPSADLLQQKAGAVLRDILHDYSAFAVSTIDRFFQQTLKAFSREIGQFASYQVELDRNSLVAESVDRILDSLTEDDSGLLKWLTDNVLEQIEQGERYSMDANLLDMAMRLKSSQRQEALEKAGINEDEAYSKERLMDIRKECRKIISAFRDDVSAKAGAILELLRQSGVEPEEFNRKFMTALYTYAEPDENVRIAAPKDSFMKRAADSDQWFAKTKAKTLIPKVYPFLESPLEDFCELWGKEYSIYNTACILDGQIYGLGVAGELRKTFAELMKEKNVLCIDDSNTILRDIIDGSDAPFVYEKLGVRFDNFLLDEFQDTANVQWTNFSPLLHNSESQGGENLVVGDVKQSIYRWRGSDWNLLDSKVPSEFPGYQEEILDTNYRSLSSIVEFNNAFFDHSARILDCNGGHADGGPLSDIYADVRQKVAKKDLESGNVTVTFCDKENELQAVLDAVMEACGAGARLSEITVLVRSNAIGEEVAGYLIENGVTVITDDSLKVKSAVSVRRLVSLMSFVDNPSDTVNGYLAASLDIEVPDACTSLIDLAEFLVRCLKQKDPEQLWKGETLHIQSFMDCLQDYVSSEGNSLRGFLKYWEGEDPSISSPTSGESVRVMTIHKSKGLDFPYVIIPFVENITLYKAGERWCSPELEGTSLEGVADGVYDVNLSSASESTLFAEHYRSERFLQQVDNINTIYVAMTRASMGMHLIAKLPSATSLPALEDGNLSEVKDFSQILYWFVASSGILPEVLRSADEGLLRFDFGKMADFEGMRKTGADVCAFPVVSGDEYPSYPLNPEPGDGQTDVRERGRLKFSADALDFFSDEGEAGISASNRIKGVVLHDILSRVDHPDELGASVALSVASGEITAEEASEVEEMLRERISEVADRGWFPEGSAEVLNERDIIDTDGNIYRPDRVVITGGKVVVVDYKFGEHYRKYERQLEGYARIWASMGYKDVEAYLWYVHTGEVRSVIRK